jgi:serine/threonine protein kinase
MGNQLAPASTTGMYQDYQKVQEMVGNFHLVGQLGGGRFLKSYDVAHGEGQLVMKLYTKRGALSLQRIKLELEQLCEKFARNWPQCCNVAAFTRIVETDRAGYMLRQHIHSNLHDRLQSRPFLHQVERKWLAYQLLQALVQGHECGVCHGDIKAENVLLTSWDWVLLTDYAPFKPRQLPNDNSADFSFFFDTPGKNGRPGRRLCYVAPERFVSDAGTLTRVQTPAAREAPTTPGQLPEPAPAPPVVGEAADRVGGLLEQAQAQQQQAPPPLPAEPSGTTGFTVPGAPAVTTPGGSTPPVMVERRDSGRRGVALEEWHPGLGQLTEAMDVFSAGCVIAEIFTGGGAWMDHPAPAHQICPPPSPPLTSPPHPPNHTQRLFVGERRDKRRAWWRGAQAPSPTPSC